MHSFRPIKSFTFLHEFDALSAQRTTRSYDLLVLPLFTKGSAAGGNGDSRSSVCTTAERVVAKMTLAHVDIDSFGPNALEESQIEATVDFLTSTYTRSSLDGFVLQVSAAKRPDQIDGLMERLYRSGIPVLLLCSHDSKTLDSISINYARGLIIENACILRNGERRDYFRAGRSRDILSRCHKEREERPDFFIGFLDQWEERPHPATICRAAKLADHFGAIIGHGPLDTSMSLKEPITSASQTISAFEYLRRQETIQVCSKFDFCLS
jgi:hypothetical protein